MNLISIDKLIPHPLNNQYFDDLTGDDWESFLEDVRENGIRDPIKVTTDFQIIAGHQRRRAALKLGIGQVPFEMMDVQNPDDIEHLLVVDNLHRRHLTTVQKAKLAATLKERWGIRRGGANGQNVHSIKDVAAAIGESEKTTQRLIKLNELIPELKRLVDSKKLGTVFAEKLASFSVDEQKALYKSFGDEIGKTLKTDAEKEAERLRNEAAHWQGVAKSAQNRPPQKIEVVPEKITRELSDLKFQLNQYKSGYEKASEQLKAFQIRDTDEFNEEQARLEREKLQHEADMNTIKLRIAYKQFVEGAAVSTFLAGAIVSASPGERQRFKDLVEMAEGIIKQAKLALNGRKVVNNDE